MKTVRETIKLIEADGWFYVGSVGSHHHFKHPSKAGKVTIPGQPKEAVPVGTWKNILVQARIRNDLRW